MGLTASSTGSDTIKQDVFEKAIGCDYTVAFAGNPNVGKTSIFNNLTGMRQHTGNWPGKTVSNAYGICENDNKKFLLVDLPGTYSLMSNSQEEEIARDYICFGNSDVCIVVVDATCLERNLNLVLQILEMTPNVIVCVNLLDEAKKKSIKINLSLLSEILGVPVVGTIANKPKTLKNLLNVLSKYLETSSTKKRFMVKYNDDAENLISDIIDDISNLLPDNKKYLARWISIKLLDEKTTIYNALQSNFNIDLANNQSIQGKLSKIKSNLKTSNLSLNELNDSIVTSIVSSAEEIRKKTCQFTNSKYNSRDRKIDKLLTSKKFGIPIMLVFLSLIFWITITGANYPSSLLSSFFRLIQEKLLILFNTWHVPEFWTNLLILRNVSNSYMGCICYATTYGYIFPYVYFT